MSSQRRPGSIDLTVAGMAPSMNAPRAPNSESGMSRSHDEPAHGLAWPLTRTTAAATNTPTRTSPTTASNGSVYQAARRRGMTTLWALSSLLALG